MLIVLNGKGIMVFYIVILKVSYTRISIEPVFFHNDIKVYTFERVGSPR